MKARPKLVYLAFLVSICPTFVIADYRILDQFLDEASLISVGGFLEVFCPATQLHLFVQFEKNHKLKGGAIPPCHNSSRIWKSITLANHSTVHPAFAPFSQDLCALFDEESAGKNGHRYIKNVNRQVCLASGISVTSKSLCSALSIFNGSKNAENRRPVMEITNGEDCAKLKDFLSSKTYTNGSFHISVNPDNCVDHQLDCYTHRLHENQRITRDIIEGSCPTGFRVRTPLRTQEMILRLKIVCLLLDPKGVEIARWQFLSKNCTFNGCHHFQNVIEQIMDKQDRGPIKLNCENEGNCTEAKDNTEIASQNRNEEQSSVTTIPYILMGGVLVLTVSIVIVVYAVRRRERIQDRRANDSHSETTEEMIEWGPRALTLCAKKRGQLTSGPKKDEKQAKQLIKDWKNWLKNPLNSRLQERSPSSCHALDIEILHNPRNRSPQPTHLSLRKIKNHQTDKRSSREVFHDLKKEATTEIFSVFDQRSKRQKEEISTALDSSEIWNYVERVVSKSSSGCISPDYGSEKESEERRAKEGSDGSSITTGILEDDQPDT